MMKLSWCTLHGKGQIIPLIAILTVAFDELGWRIGVLSLLQPVVLEYFILQENNQNKRTKA
jgi:hypothetical protein